MKVQATKTMAKEIERYAKQNGKAYRAEFVTMSRDEYARNVDDIWDNARDYNSAIGKMQVILITYPAEYYAIPRFLTTRTLSRAFHDCGEKTFDNFMKAVNNECEI